MAFSFTLLWPLYSSVITRSNSMSLSVHDPHLHYCVVAFIRFLIGQHIFTPQWFAFVCGWHPAHELVYLRTLSVWTGNRRLRERKKSWLFFNHPRMFLPLFLPREVLLTSTDACQRAAPTWRSRRLWGGATGGRRWICCNPTSCIRTCTAKTTENIYYVFQHAPWWKMTLPES